MSGFQVGGPGGGVRSERGESGLTAIKESRIVNRAIRSGWLKGQRWSTEATLEELKQKHASGTATLKNIAEIAVARNLTIDPDNFADNRSKLIAMKLIDSAVRTLSLMESQNQNDDLAELRLAFAGEQSKGLSAEVLAAVLHEIGEIADEMVGPERAREFVAELQERITVDTTSAGTLLTPDMEAAAMDATIPAGPSDEPVQ